jgi:phytoene dehydrogenase-like protein
MDPVYRLKYPDDKELLFSSDLMKIQDQLEAFEPGSYAKFLEYMDVSFKAYKVSMKHIIDRNYSNIFQFINPVSLWRLYRLNAFGNHYHTAARYFKNENLRTAFTFQNIYVGQNPFRAMAIFSMLPFMELTDGVFFPKGGMNRVSESLEKIAIENGVELADGSFFHSDVILANADLPYVYQEQLPAGKAAQAYQQVGLHLLCVCVSLGNGYCFAGPGTAQCLCF